MPRHFTNFIDSYLDFSKGHESTERVRKWCIISVLAATMERRVWLKRGHYTLFPNLYVFIIGKSGLIKKTTSTGIAVNLFRELKGARLMSERLTASSLVEQMLLSGKELDIGGKRFKQSAVFAYASELAVFMDEVFGNITELLTTFYDCIPNDSNKPWAYHTIGRGEKLIYGPCLNILGASTKSWLKKCIPASEMEGGFTSRIIFVVENNIPEKLIAWPNLNEEEELMRLKLIEDLKDIYVTGGEVKVHPDATTWFHDWYEHHMRNILPQNSDPRMIGYMSRKGDTILKLGMISSASKGVDLVVRQEDLEWALAEMDDLEQDWRNAFDSLPTQSSSLSRDILSYVSSRKCVPKMQLLQTFNSQFPAQDVMRSLADLKGMDEIVDFEKFIKGHKTACYAVPAYKDLQDTYEKAKLP